MKVWRFLLFKCDFILLIPNIWPCLPWPAACWPQPQTWPPQCFSRRPTPGFWRRRPSGTRHARWTHPVINCFRKFLCWVVDVRTNKIITCFPNKICVVILYCLKLNWTQVLSFLGRVHQFSTRRVMEIRLAGLWEQPNSVMPKKGRDKGDRPLWCSFWACFLRG